MADSNKSKSSLLISQNPPSLSGASIKDTSKE